MNHLLFKVIVYISYDNPLKYFYKIELGTFIKYLINLKQYSIPTKYINIDKTSRIFNLQFLVLKVWR